MQNNIAEDEQEPRSVPRLPTKFDQLSWSLTPELSLILERSIHSKKMNDTPPKVSEHKINNPQNSFVNDYDTYAAWRAKKFPPLSNKPAPSNFSQVHSSTQNSSNLQDSHTPKSKNHVNPVDHDKYNRKNQDYSSELARKDNYTNKNDHYSRQINKNDKLNSDTFPDSGQFISNNNDNYDDRPKIVTHRSPNPREYHVGRIEHDNQLQQYRPLSNNYYPEHTHHLPPCCSHNHNHNTPNTETETIKNLLQVITSQNEQIKNLQMQLRKLLRIHEQSLKDYKRCTCQPSNYAFQNTHIHDQTRASNFPISNEAIHNREHYFNDLKIQEEKNQQAILEQKVSIGVMTSFELKLQNNSSPAMEKSEAVQSNDSQKVLPVSETSSKIKNLINNTGEMIRKPSNNFFTPTILENISEGSESHMSSHRQSHLFMDSIRHSNEDMPDLPELSTPKLKPKDSENNQIDYKNLQSRRHKNSGSNKNTKTTNNLDNFQNAASERPNSNFREKLPYQYHNQKPEISPRSSPEDFGEKQEYNSLSEPLLNDIRKIKNTQIDNLADDCLSLSSDEIDLDDFSPESPEPSIHIDLQEFSSESGSLPPQRAAKVGWTICNNVLDQVNQMFQKAPVNENFDQDFQDDMRNERVEHNSNTVNKVKAATYEQLKNFGVSISDMEQREPTYMKRVMFDATYYPIQVPEAHIATSASIETNTSMYINALAMKYVKEEQVTDLPKQRYNQSKQVPFNNVQNTNMSFATLQYLQRYNLINPGANNNFAKEPMRRDYREPPAVYNERLVMKAVERREISPQRYHHNSRGTSKTSLPNKILDITALKQQPKLL